MHVDSMRRLLILYMYMYIDSMQCFILCYGYLCTYIWSWPQHYIDFVLYISPFWCCNSLVNVNLIWCLYKLMHIVIVCIFVLCWGQYLNAHIRIISTGTYNPENMVSRKLCCEIQICVHAHWPIPRYFSLILCNAGPCVMVTYIDSM